MGLRTVWLNIAHCNRSMLELRRDFVRVRYLYERFNEKRLSINFLGSSRAASQLRLW